MIINISNSAKDELNNMFKEFQVDNRYLRVYIKEVSAWYGPVSYTHLTLPTNVNV